MAIIFMYLQDRIIINRDNGEFYYHLSDSKTKVGEYKDGSGKYRYMKQEELVMVNKEFVNEMYLLKDLKDNYNILKILNIFNWKIFDKDME